MLNYLFSRKVFGTLICGAGLLAAGLPASAQMVVNDQIFVGGGTAGNTGMAQTMLIFGLPPVNVTVTVTGPGTPPLNFIQTTQQGPSNPSLTVPASGNLYFPMVDQPYTETIQIMTNPVVTYTNTIWSANVGSYAQESTKQSVIFLLGNAVPAGSNFPYTVGIRLHGSSAMTATQTITGSSYGGQFSASFLNLPPSTTYDWCVVQGATVNPNDPATAQFLNTHHVATTSI
jgi:hypothetical protein